MAEITNPSLVTMAGQSPLLQFVPEFEYYLVDLTQLREEDLNGALYLRAGLLTLKWIFDRALAERLPDIFKAIKAGPKRPLLDHLKTVSKYLSKVKGQATGGSRPRPGKLSHAAELDNWLRINTPIN